MSKMKKRIETLVKLGMFAGVVMYGINKVIESSALVRNLLPEYEGERYQWSQGVVFYKKIGEGSPILLLHDLEPSSSGFEWSSISEDLALDHTVYILDLPGCGRSGKITNETYINYYYVRLLKEFIDNVIEEKTDVIATGYSGSFVTMAASIHENIIGEITMINPIHPERLASSVTWKSKLVKALLDCPVLGTFLYYIDYSKEQLDYRFNEKLFYNPFEVTSRITSTYYESAHLLKGNGKYLLSSMYGNYMSVDITRALSTLKNPVTIIFGKELPGASATADCYRQINPKVKTIFLSRTKQLPQLEQPAKLLHYILK